MLCELRVKNLALIESLELDFDRDGSGGLVVMTGETGAGKSIMLRAIHLLSGRRASSDWIRNGADSCEVEALFAIDPGHHHLLESLVKSGFGDDTSLLIKRTLNSSGRSRFYINGSLATGKIVSELSAELINIASQHDHQQLLQPALHLDYLDTYGDLWPLRQTVTKTYNRWQKKSVELANLKRIEQEKVQKQDFLRYQVDEIGQAKLQPGEEELLQVEKNRLKNAQSLINLAQISYQLISNDLIDNLGQLRQNVAQLAALDSAMTKLSEDISNYSFLAEDYVNALREYRDSLEDNPYRLEQISERLDLLQQFKRKYGPTIDDILAFAERSELELLQLENMGKEIQALEEEVSVLQQDMCNMAGNLCKKRKDISEKLEKSITIELTSLAFDRPDFKVRWQETKQLAETMQPNGWDRGEFFFSANLGEPVKPLANIASGGELSRLMLAMKCLLARKDMVETVIFDEVDAGIGGEAAEAVARKIQELSLHHQVFCITHLPQIAARGTIHFQVFKKVEEGRTQSAVIRLSPDSRVKEMVRMLAGDSATKETQAWATELLASGSIGR